MQRDLAQILAIRSLGWLAGEEELWLGFLGQSGADAAQVRAGAARQDRALLLAVLDYLMLSDAWVMACATALAVAPADFDMARAVLGGGDRTHWT